MIEYGLPVLYALFLWWFSTGLVLFLDGLPRRTFRWTMLGATAVLVASVWGIASTATQADVAGAYVAFTCSLLAWGWQEMAHYLGYITGPRRAPCPPGCGGWQRFRYAVAAIAWHEIAIAVGALAILALTWDAPNQVAAWTYLVLWGMRISAKLNVFLGVPNLNENWLPAHLGYLGSYFGRKPMNPLFPLSVTAATVVLVLLVTTLLAAPAGSATATGLLLLASLLGLGGISERDRCWARL